MGEGPPPAMLQRLQNPAQPYGAAETSLSSAPLRQQQRTGGGHNGGCLHTSAGHIEGSAQAELPTSACVRGGTLLSPWLARCH